MALKTLAAVFIVIWLTGISSAGATTCEEAVAKCQFEGANKANIVAKCQAAGASCRKSGRFVGPITGRDWKNIRRN